MRRAAALLMVLLAGCGGAVPLPVSGKVTFNGLPVAEGKIVFEPQGQGTPVTADIRGGEYATKVPAGTYKVRISASREVPGAKADPAMGAVPRQEYIPARFNALTTLTAEVKAGDENNFDYPLADKP